ncbi:MAG: hypothetical protein KC643_06990 [Nitrospira sp.]|nr:hypothetical protein [Nitrospira sp.]
MKVIAITVSALLLFGVAGKSQAATVDVTLSPFFTNVVGLNHIFNITILGNYHADGTEKLLGGALNLMFDQSILNVKSVTVNAPTDISGNTGSINNTNGLVDTIGFATFSGIPGGPFSFASIEFESIGFGQSLLQLSDSTDLVFAWANENAEAVAVNSVNGIVNVTPVPLPAGAWLFVSGLGSLFALKIQRKIRRRRFREGDIS